MKKFLILFLFFPIILYSQNIKVYEIYKEEVWEGEKIIEGIVVVKEGAKLIIKPGTRVYFKQLDYDNDEIGDGELYVEGELNVLGEKEKPVLFTTSGPVQPKSWKYVMLNHSKNSFINNAVFEGAFSGLQVHFSKVKIRDCIFRKNVDGFRFSTANIDVCGCTMTENKYGIRYEERDSKGFIRFCEITKNEIGIFPVTKGEGKVIFEMNNIYDNEYNIRMGDDQKKDLDFSNNYFGFKKIKDIKMTIYDKRIDRNLSSVKIKTFFKEKIKRRDLTCQ